MIEGTLEGYRIESMTIEKAAALSLPRVHPAWVMTKLERLDDLLRRDPQRAKVEILKHLDGDLKIVPRPSVTGERRAEISGRARSDSLLGPQEAVCLQVVAGACNYRNQLGLLFSRSSRGARIEYDVTAVNALEIYVPLK